ncbi:amidohydrolase [Adhaeribacter arboris]|uniref:Amidohydrolase n=1 Tax=Adhaeribacter arboris TaxID=2072846 RepID=A0A2T2YIZ1_9BACT|nr:amidohydrolase family protein [Adhaeribacter arboris]PSR55477.1 amidohydrolase [Adhaeribacter arboris]
MTRTTQLFLLLASTFLPIILPAARAQQTMTIEEYEPKSTLVVPQHPVTKAKYPFIDVHNHQNSSMSKEALNKLVKEMDALNMRTMINLSGGSGSELKSGVANLKNNYPNRFVVFANVDFSKMDDPNFGEKAAAQLEQDVRNGAQGLKIFKNLGMTVKDKNGKRVPTDDPRLNPIWQKCAELKIPVLIHTGEPRSFFDPIDKYNERWLELTQFPNRARPSSEYPSWQQVMQEQHNLFAKHPKTIFINAHLGWLGGDLATLGKLMDKMPNMYTEIGAVLAELGRQPHFAREWFIKYQDRVLFGKDAYEPTEYHTYFRVLETDDEYFNYYRKRHAFWKMYGLNLPDEVLKKLYYKNALKIIPRLDATGFPK